MIFIQTWLTGTDLTFCFASACPQAGPLLDMWEDDDVLLLTQESFDRYHAHITESVAALEDPDDDVPLFTQERFAAARAAATAAAAAAIARETAMEDPDDNVPLITKR